MINERFLIQQFVLGKTHVGGKIIENYLDFCH